MDRGRPGRARLAVRLVIAAVLVASSSLVGLRSSAGAPGGNGPDLASFCGTFTVIRLPDGGALCTHGPDPAPPGVDFRVPWSPPQAGGAEGQILPDPPTGTSSRAAGGPGIGCYPDGEEGNRVQAVYAFPADRRDRYAQALPYIRQWAAETDAVFQASAAATGGTRRIRFVTDPNCQLTVIRVALSAQGDDTFDNTIAELAAQGYSRSDRKYLVWMDATELCGIATYYPDSRASTDRNLNNGRAGVPASVQRIDAGCWGFGSEGQSIEGHELMHSLGAVLPTAPHSTYYGHCSDDDDLMCYADGSPLLVLQDICPPEQEAVFDCRHDDYFHTAPPAGSFLASNWNTANNSFLSDTSSSPSVAVADSVSQQNDLGDETLSFAVTLSRPDKFPVAVDYATVDGSARAADDYQATSGRLLFQPGETQKLVTVAIAGGEDPDVTETFLLVLSSPSNAILDRAQAFGTILDGAQAPQGYWFVAADGGIFAFGNAQFYGSTGNIRLNKPIVGMARTPSNKGYWLVASDGGVFAFGDAQFYGSTGNINLNKPIVGMVPTRTGKGYWFVASDGGVFTFGDAAFHGAATGAATPIAGIAATRTGKGYWCVTRSGQVYGFGDAQLYGGAPSGADVVSIFASQAGQGYRLAGSDGTVYAFGDARHLGQVANLNQPIVGLAGTAKGVGYWLVARDGGIFAFGAARFYGSTGDIRLNQPIVGMAVTSPF